MSGYICIHGHFYQPPRENPFLEWIEVQESAYPYHDWNERVNAECYAPNALSRILDDRERIIRIVNNYERMSFNFGPTLISWLRWHSHFIYKKIIEADRLSAERHSGHGNAIAQAYNHIIMPLANLKDRTTQVIWGIRDFQKHFGRKPEGMWLPETAVDTGTLELLAVHGITFTILSPIQAKRVRPIGHKRWTDVTGGSIDTTMPYLVNLPSGAKITVFFYNGVISHDLAFEDLLKSGEVFTRRLLDAFPPERTPPPIVSVATDGETYGHHHKFGDMALAYTVDSILREPAVSITNYGRYLSLHKPTYEVQIIEDSSWSCSHGLERWRSDCGCTTNAEPSWNQAWRAPLRNGLDWLSSRLSDIFSKYSDGILNDPWDARNDYIDVVLDRTGERKEAFFRRHAKEGLSREERIRALCLLEMQRNGMLMYTSCGWFFEDISRIETIQVLRYAARAIELAERLSGERLEEGLLGFLSDAKSNRREMGTGADIYRRFVKPSAVDLRRVAVHYAISSFIEEYPEATEICCFTIEREDVKRLQGEDASISTGILSVSSGITEEAGRFIFSVLRLGLHDYTCLVKGYDGDPVPEDEYTAITETLFSTFKSGKVADLVRGMERHLGTDSYGIRDLMKDEQERLLNILIKGDIEAIERQFSLLYDKNRYLIGLLSETGHRVPGVFRMVAETALKRQLYDQISSTEFSDKRAAFLLQELKRWDIKVGGEWLEMMLRRRLEAEMKRLMETPDMDQLLMASRFLSFTFLFPVQVNLWTAQNIYHELSVTVFPNVREKAEEGDTDAIRWRDEFFHMGRQLFFNVDEILK